MKKSIYKWILKVSYFFVSFLPIKNKIMIASNNTDKLDRNLKYIYDEIKRENIDVKVVFRFNKAKKTFLSKVHSILYNMGNEYHIATSKIVIVDDYFFPLYVIKKKEKTKVIQVWHASGAFKKIGYSVVDKSFGASKNFVKKVKIHSNYDYCIMGSKYNAKFYSEAFDTPMEKFVTDVGIPRTDVFFNENLKKELPQKIRERYNIPNDKKIILYAPTFRGNSRFKSYYKDDLDFDILREYLEEEYVILLKLHPFIAKKYEIKDELKNFLFDVTDYKDINELMIISDMMITDYSSAIFDYSLLKRPMFFYASDYFDYLDERGFYIDFHKDLPGEIYTNTKDLAKDISEKNFNIDKVETFRDNTFEVTSGNSSYLFVQKLIMPNLK